MSSSFSVSWSSFEPVADHLWQSTGVLAVVAALVVMLRNNRASVRYWLWLLASAKFAVPFAVLTSIGSAIAWPEGRAVVSQFIAPASVVAEPFGQVVMPLVEQAGARGSADASLWPSALVVVWLVGMLALAARWLIRWRGIATIAAAGSPATAGREVGILRALERRAGHRRELPVVLTDAVLEPGVFGVWRPQLLWPRDISGRLDDRQIEAVLAHELAHVRRYDNLAALAHMAVQAVFWFHPLVWGVGARLIQERERACDEDVLRLGSDPATYAESILETCRFHVESPVACVSGVTGSDLKRRIEQIMTKRATQALTIRRKLLLTAVVLAGLVGPVLAGSMRAGSGVEAGGSGAATAQHLEAAEPNRIGPSLHSYSLFEAFRKHFPLYRIHRIGAHLQSVLLTANQNPPAAAAEFEVASVKENRSDDRRITFGLQPGGRFTATGVSLRELIRFAYSVQMSQIEGGPDWIDTTRFDVLAKAPEGTTITPASPGELGPMNLMLRDLLATRFNLVVERPLKDAPVYELVMARTDRKLGPNLQVSKTDCATLLAARRGGGPPSPLPQPGEPMTCGIMMAPNRFQAGGTRIAQLAQILSQRVGRIVIDETRLTESYDFTLEFTPDPGLGDGPPDAQPGAPLLPAVDPNAPSLFTALQEQLGLKLESRRAPVEMLSIKSVEMPTPD
jgi:uncharacterized protein (TIGR03435 family)